MTKPSSSAHQWAWLLALFGGVGALGWFRASRRPAPTAPAPTAPAPTAPAPTAPAPTASAPHPPTASRQFSASFIEAPTGNRRKRTPVTRTLPLVVTPLSTVPTPSTSIQTQDLTLYNVQRFRPPPLLKQSQVAVVTEKTKEPVAEETKEERPTVATIPTQPKATKKTKKPVVESRVVEETKEEGPTVATTSVIQTQVQVPVSKGSQPKKRNAAKEKSSTKVSVEKTKTSPPKVPTPKAAKEKSPPKVSVEKTKEPVVESRVVEGPRSVIPTVSKGAAKKTKEPTQVTVPEVAKGKPLRPKDTDVTLEPAVSVSVETPQSPQSPQSGIMIRPSTPLKEKPQARELVVKEEKAQQLVQRPQEEKAQQLVQRPQEEKAQQQRRPQEEKARTERLRVGNRRDSEIKDLLDINRILSKGPQKPKGFLDRLFGASEPVDTSHEDLMRKFRNTKEINRLAEIVAEEHKTLETVRKNWQAQTKIARQMEEKNQVEINRSASAPSTYIVSSSPAMKALQRKAVCEAFLEEVYNNGVQLSYALTHLKKEYDRTEDEVRKEADVQQWLRSTTINLITPWVHKYRAFKTEFANMGCEDPIHDMHKRVEKLGELVNKLKGLIDRMGVSWNDIA